jgi:hypothetical protein
MSEEYNKNKKYIKKFISPFVKDPVIPKERVRKAFLNMNESLNLKKMNPDKLLGTKQGNNFFIKIIIKEMGASVRQTTTYGYEVNIPYNQKNKEILEYWKDEYGFDYEVDRITNTEHPNYPGTFFKFNFYKSHELPNIDTSDVIKKINGIGINESNNVGFSRILNNYTDEFNKLNKQLDELNKKHRQKFTNIITLIINKVGLDNINDLMDDGGELEDDIFDINLEYYNERSTSIDIGHLGGFGKKGDILQPIFNTPHDTYPIDFSDVEVNVLKDIIEMLLGSSYVITKLNSNAFLDMNNS